MTPPADEVTSGELSRRLDAMERRMDAGFGRVSQQVENLQFVHRDAYQAEQRAVVDRLVKLEQSKTWIARSVVGSVIFPVLTAALIAWLLVRGGP
jgi:hypothetical protein